jgi:hypothetical protein
LLTTSESVIASATRRARPANAVAAAPAIAFASPRVLEVDQLDSVAPVSPRPLSRESARVVDCAWTGGYLRRPRLRLRAADLVQRHPGRLTIGSSTAASASIVLVRSILVSGPGPYLSRGDGAGKTGWPARAGLRGDEDPITWVLLVLPANRPTRSGSKHDFPA